MGTTIKGQRPGRLEGSMQTEQTKLGDRGIFSPPSLSCFTAEGLALFWVSILGQSDRQGLTVRFVSRSLLLIAMWRLGVFIGRQAFLTNHLQL